MTNKFYGYYNSPTGGIEIITDESSILSVMFVDKIYSEGKSNEILNKAIFQLDEYFKGIRRDFDLNISLQGTDFQRLVWNETRRIPFGETLTYRELAFGIGNEGAARAVGNANSRNVISIIVPSHRLVGKNRKLTDYPEKFLWKKWLLEHEKRLIQGHEDYSPLNQL